MSYGAFTIAGLVLIGIPAVLFVGWAVFNTAELLWELYDNKDWVVFGTIVGLVSVVVGLVLLVVGNPQWH